MNNIIKNINTYSIFSNSQIKQDIFVLSVLKFKKNGFFVEFGGCDGKHLSNTYILEKNFNWQGILSEPAKLYHDALEKNRDCFIDKNAVYSETGKSLEFQMVEEHTDLSGLIDHLNENKKDKHRHKRNNKFISYIVNTISLEDLLKKYNAPSDIDYLSIDTEGSEFEILNNFNFYNYKIKIITVEHNYQIEKRLAIKNLLEKNGFLRVLDELSQWDDWYINKSILKEIEDEKIFNNSSD